MNLDLRFTIGDLRFPISDVDNSFVNRISSIANRKSGATPESLTIPCLISKKDNGYAGFFPGFYRQHGSFEIIQEKSLENMASSWLDNAKLGAAQLTVTQKGTWSAL